MNDRSKKYIKWTVILIVIVAILIPVILNLEKVMAIISDPERIKRFVLSYGNFSFVIFVIMQILQIVIFFIPGEVVQFAGGYIFGPYISFLLAILGIVIGSGITFMISRKFGKPFVEKIVSEDSLWIIKKLDAAKHHREERHPGKKMKMHPKIVIFVLYMIPGIPKDILGYISGISDISLKEFLIVSTIARSPALFMSCFFGNKLDFIKNKILSQGMGANVTAGVVAIIAIIFIFIIGKKIVKKLKEDVDG